MNKLHLSAFFHVTGFQEWKGLAWAELEQKIDIRRPFGIILYNEV